MPTLSRYFTWSALLYLGIGFTIGGLLLSAKDGLVDNRIWNWLPVHIILMMNGWLIQLSLGVAYWIIPRIQLNKRGRRAWAWAGFVALQIGLMLTLSTTFSLWLPAMRALFVPALILQYTGVILFAVHAWPRIRPTFVRAAVSRQL